MVPGRGQDLGHPPVITGILFRRVTKEILLPKDFLVMVNMAGQFAKNLSLEKSFVAPNGQAALQT
jgi:hypothetical protein